MIDEAHERSMSSDLLLGLLKKIIKRRPELRIVVSSATIQAQSFLDFFSPSAPPEQTEKAKHSSTPGGIIIKLEGRSYPVDMHYLMEAAEDYVQAAVDTVFDIHSKEEKGDILIFMTGREEIETVIEQIGQHSATLTDPLQTLQALPLYAGLTVDQQMYVFEPAPEGVRKVVVATNIAEASVTIDGIVYVIDSGFVKLRAFNPSTNIETLTATPVSKASAIQRSGRAGRTRPGKCYRLYTEEAYDGLEGSTVPEIQRSNLAPVILQLKALGIENVARFDFLTPPPSKLVVRALELLFALGVLDNEAKLTKPLGVQMAELALEPMLGKVLLSAVDFGCLSEMLTIAAMTSLDGSAWFSNDENKKEMESSRCMFAAEEGDHITLLNVYQAFTTKGKKEVKWCREHFLNFQSLSRATSIRNQLKRYLERLGFNITETRPIKGDQSNVLGKAERIRRCLTSGYFSHAARFQPDGTFRTIDGMTVLHAHPSSLMFVSLAFRC